MVLIQEAKVAEVELNDTEATMRAKGWSVSISACGKGAKGGKSAGVAVGVRAHIGMTSSLRYTPPVDCSTERLTIKKIGACITGGFHAGSLYLISRIGVKAKADQDILEAASARLALLMGPWVLGGDSSCTPQEFIDAGWLAVVKGKIVYPKGKTCTAGYGPIRRGSL